jgi:hypothetical protein
MKGSAQNDGATTKCDVISCDVIDDFDARCKKRQEARRL